MLSTDNFFIIYYFFYGRYDFWPVKAGTGEQWGEEVLTLENSYPPVDIYGDDLN